MNPEFVKAVRVTFVMILIGGAIFLFDYFKRLKDDSQEVLFETCLKLANERFVIDWNNSCQSLGAEKACNLPVYFSESIKKRYEREQEDCYSKYPQ